MKPPRTIGRFTADEVARIVGVPAARISDWVRLGLLEPLDSPDGALRFGCAQILVANRSLRASRGEFLAGVCQAAREWTPTRLSALFTEALDHERSGRWNAAARRYRQAIMLSPDDPAIRFNLGNVRMAQGRLDRALVRYEETLALDPGHVPAWNNLGLAHLRSGRVRDAEAAFRLALDLAPEYSPARRNLELALRSTQASTKPIARAA